MTVAEKAYHDDAIAFAAALPAGGMEYMEAIRLIGRPAMIRANVVRYASAHGMVTVTDDARIVPTA